MNSAENHLDIDSMKQRLSDFCRAKYRDPRAELVHLEVMPGHAGFSWGFTVESRGKRESWFIRLPPPNVRWRGTADVLRQVEVLNALDRTDVPHCTVKWSGKDLKWFGCPYFVTPLLQGDVLRFAKGDWAARLKSQEVREIARQAMQALVGIHRLDPAQTPYLGDPVPPDQDVVRWDAFLERAADPHRLAGAQKLRKRLLERRPECVRMGVFHGDFQSANLFCSQSEPRLLAVIDFELTGIGAVLNDLGWVCAFSDECAWADGRGGMFLDAEQLAELYVEAWGAPVEGIDWYRALACYKFAIITGFNLSLHRRGKRVDETWEVSKLSMTPLIDRATQLLEEMAD